MAKIDWFKKRTLTLTQSTFGSTSTTRTWKLNLMFNGKQRCAIAKNKEGTEVVNKIWIEYLAIKLSRI
jgi:hypothetical protein